MAKKYRVKYAFGTPAAYAAAKAEGKLDEYTVYFIADEGEEFGTIYRGPIEIGTAQASDLVFSKEVVITLAQASDPEDEDLTITIPKGENLVSVVTDLYKREYNDTTALTDRLDVLTAESGPGSLLEIVSAIILDKTEDGTLYSKDYLDENFATKEWVDGQMGAVQELLDVFRDPETGEIKQDVIDTIVAAAEGIEAVVKDYYKKTEIDEKLVSATDNIIKTYDTSAGFPDASTANKNVFYVDDEENIVYRWALNEEGTAREYTEISGSGSGGGGDVKLETKIYIKGGKTTVSVAKGNNLDVEFVFSSANTMTRYNKKTHEFEKIQQQTGTTGSAKYYFDGVQIDSGYVSQSNYNDEDDSKNIYNKFVVPAARMNASKHTLKIYAEDVAGNFCEETVNINVVSATITSSYVPTPLSLEKNLEIPVTVTSTDDAELFYTIDGGETIKVQDVPVGSPVVRIIISPMIDETTRREHGDHTVNIWATTYIAESGTTISTRVLSYNVIWYDPANSLPIITTTYDLEENEQGKYDITQYHYATLTYQVYPGSTVDLIIRDVTGGIERIVNTLAVDTITRTWTYTFDTVGEYEVYINVHYGAGGSEILRSKKYDVVVAESEEKMDPTPGSVVFFTAKNRSNSEVNPAQWHSEVGNYDASLEGFLWNANSGWYTEGATTALRVAGGAKCTIPYKPFERDRRTRGQVIEFDFSTKNLSDATATVISCYSGTDRSGIEITATGAYFSSTEFGKTSEGDARIFVPFKENERIRLSFVITPLEEDEEGHGPDDPEATINLWNGSSYAPVNTITSGWWRFVKVYINGICVGMQNYNSSFQQTAPSSIVIGSDKATVDIYSIRAYEIVLYDRSIVNNFIADTQDPTEKLRLFKRNNILNELGTDVEPTALRRLMPCLFVTCESDAAAKGITNNEHILPTNKADKRGVTVFFDCDGLDDEAKEYYNFCHSFVALNVQWTVQGTSSQYYPRRNWKGTLKTEKKFKEDYVATVTNTSDKAKPTYLFVDIPWEESIKDGRDARAVFANKYKSNYTNKYQLKDFSAISDDHRTVDEISSIPAKKFCMKADFAESSGTHNTGFAKYVDVILKSLGEDYLTPPQKAQYNKTRRMSDVTFRTSVDGYPIAMFWRPTYEDDWEFYGKFNFNLDKGAESVFGFIDYSDGGLSASDLNPMTGQPFIQFDEDYYDNASLEDRLAYESPVECWEFTNNSTDLCKFRNVTPTSFTEMIPDPDSDPTNPTYIPAWIGSFEVRHPDNDNLIDIDYGTGLKKPDHWAKFSEWVSSTDRTGRHNYDKNLPIPTAWTKTYDELIAGSSSRETVYSYEGKLINGELVPSRGEIPLQYEYRYVLEPWVRDEGDGTWSPDYSYDLYGHLAHFNSVDSEWYDPERPLDIWVEDGEYHEDSSEIDYNKAYYISNPSDSHNGRVYKYNTETTSWDDIASISAYALDAPVTYNMVTYQYDTAEYRFAKFKAELPLHMNIPMTTAYYVLTEFFCCADQRAKNMMFASWGYEPGASKVKPANAFPSEEAADAAGYKPVYKYEIGTVAAAATPSVYAASAPTRGLVLGAAPATVCINEIHPDGKKMEFYNPTSSPIDLTGYTLRGVDDSGAARDPWTFSSSFVGGTTIAANGYKVIEFVKAADGGDGTKGPIYGLSNKKAWSFSLENASGVEIDSISNEGHVTLGTKSLGRETDGAETWTEFEVPTIGEVNAGGEEPGIPTTELVSHLSYTTTAEELSGICFNADKTALFGVSDRGKLYSIAFDGTTTEIVIATLADEDLEGITIDSNGDLYAINERTGQVWKIEGPDYDTATAAFIVTPVGDNPSSNGFEGIAAYGNQFIVGNQKNPIALYTISSLGGSPILLAELDCVTEIADVAYDGTNIWVLDSTEATLAKLATDGTLVEKFSMPFISTSDHGPEGLAIDGDIAFVGCDNANMDLFKVSLTNDPLTTTVVINEIASDSIELYNPTGSPVNIGGLWLVKTPQAADYNEGLKPEGDGRSDAYQIPAGTTVASHGFVTFGCKGAEIPGAITPGPQYGISFKSESKKFDLYLMQNIGSMATAIGSQTIDPSKVIDHIDNYTHPVIDANNTISIGRVLDGYTTICKFATPTIGETNNNSVPIPIDGDTPASGTIKTVLYWVPKESEYIYYPIFYDNDTILSLDNTGHIKFNPNVESTDRVGTGYAFNGTESVLWLNFKDAYDAEIRDTYREMRSKGGLTYVNCMKYFNTGQSDQWPENVYNIDGKFKYVIPATKGYLDYSTQDPNTGKYGVLIRNASYLYECQGGREEHRKWWLNNRFTYMDSRYFAVAYAEDYATIRLYTPSIWEGITPSSTFKLTPYADMYLRVMFGQIITTVRAEKNKEYDVAPPDPELRFNDTETIIYGASNLLSLGDISNKYAGSVAIEKASKITDIDLGSVEPYYNENVTGTGLKLGAGNTTLKNVDVEGCTKLTGIENLDAVTSIEKVNARRTGITKLEFAKTGANLNEIHYPATIAEVKFVNMKNIAYDKIDIPNYSNLKTLWIENCPLLRADSWRIISNILSTADNVLTGARIVDFEWNITTNAAYEIWKKVLKLSGFNSSGIQEYDIPYLSGIVNIGGEVVVSTGYKEAIEAMFEDAGGLRVNVTGRTVGLNGVKIVPERDILDREGVAEIVPGVEYTFNASYLPDDFVLASERGVTWAVPDKLTIVSQTPEKIVLKYVGSTSGSYTYTITATSTSNPSYTAALSIRPTATLSKIVVSDTTGREVTGDININEGETKIFNISFVPVDTEDTSINFSAAGGNYIEYSYDSYSRTLAITGKDVDQTRACGLTLTSATVPSVKTTLGINVVNVVSRIIKLKDSAGEYIPGSIEVDYTDSTGQAAHGTEHTQTGIIALRTDSKYGFSELRIKAKSNAAEIGEKYYNDPAAFIMTELPVTATVDVEKEVVFYEPVTYTITVNNAGSPVKDRTLQIDSLENETIRGLVTPPYNRVRAGAATSPIGSPVQMQLLANTTHHITITELDEHGDMIVSGGRYSQYVGTIEAKTTDDNITITIARDYLGNINDDTELHMTLLTGTAASGYNVARLYVKVTGEITIDWGDKVDNPDPSYWSTTINGTNYPFNKMITLYHVYQSPSAEYEISVTANTGRIRWFHVIQENATAMLPCFGTTQSPSGFNTSWTSADQASGAGLVAYQSSGAAQFEVMPRFNFANTAQKSAYCKLLCVGNIYKNCYSEDITKFNSAEGLFENTTLEQISSTPLFERCTNIKSFARTFKNTNITILPPNFFMGNTRAEDFRETFMNCEYLSTINTSEDITFVNPDDDVEVTSVSKMFSGCVNLTSAVPALWKTFYGCSFAHNVYQMAYENCEKVLNYENIPGDWGGYSTKKYIEHEYKPLRYLYFGDTATTAGDISITTDIQVKGHYQYICEFGQSSLLYEAMPLFSAGKTDGVEGHLSNEEYLETALNFNRGGQPNGSKNPDKWYDSKFLTYRLGSAANTEFSLAQSLNGSDGKVFDGIGYGSASGDRVVLDISHDTEGHVIVYPYGNYEARHDFILADWNNPGVAEWESDLPIRFVQPYNTMHIYNYELDPTGQTYYDEDKLYRGKFLTIYRLQIFDDTYLHNLVADIVPVYGQVPGTAPGTTAVMLYNKVTGTAYTVSVPVDDSFRMKFYNKNEF